MNSIKFAYNDILSELERISKNKFYDIRVCKKCPYDDFCCNDIIPITYIEAYIIYDYLGINISKYTNNLKRRFNRICKSNLTQPNSWTESNCIEWKSKNHKCPFYTNENKCEIYEVRPIACRLFYATGSCNCINSNNKMIYFPSYEILKEFSMQFSDDNHFGELSSIILSF